MADLAQLEQGLIKAHQAGNEAHAKIFADEIRKLRAQPQAEVQKEGMLDQLGGAAVATGAGLLKGAADIGATILSPFDAAGLSEYTPSQRREELKGFASQFNRPAFTAGEITSNIAGTAGAGGVLAGGVRKAAQLVPEMAAALESGGFAAAPLKTRLAGGAVSGGAMAGMVNPEDAGVGAGIGAALPAGAALVTKGIPAVAREIAGVTSGVGGTPLSEAFRVGKTGGDAAKSFRKNISGEAQLTDVLESAKQNLANMNAAKSAEYRANMDAIKTDQSILKFDGVDNAIKKAFDIVTFKGQVKNTKGADVLRQLSDEIGNWKQLDPAQYHTPEGLDALKQAIGGIVDSIPYEEKTARLVGNSIYNSIKSEIAKQAPSYAKTMQSYTDSTELIREAEKALSLGNKASADTAMRKLQSLMRNNVSTNYGQRVDIAKQLEKQGGNEIMPALAGQSLSELAPRGIARAGNIGGFMAAGAVNPLSLAALPIASPRLMGEAAYASGVGARGVNRLAELLGANQVPEGLTQSAIINALNR